MTAGFYQQRAGVVRPVMRMAVTSLQHRPQPPEWETFARPEQVPPAGDWRTWLILAGRRWGKTRTGAETIVEWDRLGMVHSVAAIGQTAADSRDVLATAFRNRIVGRHSDGGPIFGRRPGVTYEPSKRLVTLANGATVTFFSAEDPDSLRGYGFDCAWSDELAAWRYPDAWDQLQFGLSLGAARQIVTTTPRPVRVVRELMADPTTIVTRGRTLDNAANLGPAAVEYLLARYQGTRLGRQELDAEILDDVPGALWTRDTIQHRPVPLILREGKAEPALSRVVVAIDPNVSSEEGADEAGITVHGLGYNGYGYVLADRSAGVGPLAWAKRALQAAADFKADAIIAEQNNGGEMVRLTIESARRDVKDAWKGPIKLVTASRGKRTRAEPVAMLYEQGRIFHVEPFEELEEQLCTWTPESGDSPDRLDANVWGWTELMLGGTISGQFSLVA